MSIKKTLMRSFIPTADIEFSSLLNKLIQVESNKLDRTRLDILRESFNLPFCRFSKLPVPIINKFGRDFQAISNFVDDRLSTRIGMTNNVQQDVLEEVSGKTYWGDGYKVRAWRNPLMIDVYISFGRYYNLDCDFKFRLKFIKNKKSKRILTFVDTYICGDNGYSEPYCQQFRLFDDLDIKKFRVQCLLLSVVEKIDSFIQVTNYGINMCFRQPMTDFRGKLMNELKGFNKKVVKIKESKQPLIIFGSVPVDILESEKKGSTSETKIGADLNKNSTTRSYRDVVVKSKPVERKTPSPDKDAGKKVSEKSVAVKSNVAKVANKKAADPFCDVRFHTDNEGKEYFTVRYRDGKTKYINNGCTAVVDMFNATLGEGQYTIHPKCLTPSGRRFASYPNSYCWLDAFCLAKKKIPAECVPYPSLTYGYLLRCGLAKVLRGHVTLHGNGYGHFDARQYYKYSKPHASLKVGVKLEDGINVNVKNADVFFDDIFASVLNQPNLRTENDVMSNVMRRLSHKINESLERKKDINISVCLSTNEKKMLSDIFPELCLNFSESSHSSHPLFTAMRDCENYHFAKKMKFRDYIDAGGNICDVVRKNLKDVHVCSPVVDVKDSQRMMARSNMLDKTSGFDESVTMCTNLCQECHHESQNIIAVQVYDMTLMDMGKAILSHKAKRFDFSVIIPPEIIEEQCQVKMFGDSLIVKSDGRKCTYYYGSSGECYEHDVENLRQILSTQIFSVDGVLFRKTLEDSRGGLHFFSVVPCLGMKNGKYTLKSFYPKTEMDKVLMLVPVKNKFGIVENVRVKTDRSIVYHLLEYVMNTAQRIDDKSYEYLMSQFRARKSITIKGGKVIQEPFELPLESYPGYLGIILGEGLRLREKTLSMAKMSYWKHYLPTIYRIIISFLHKMLSKSKELMYGYALKGLRLVMSDEFIEDLTNGDRRIFDVKETYEFVQEVNIVGQEGECYVINESFSRFIHESKQNIEKLDEPISRLEDYLEEDDLDRVKEMALSGGGSFDVLSNTGYRYYEKIYNMISLVCIDKEKVHKISGVVSMVFFYLVKCGKSALSQIKDVLKKLISMLFSGVKGIGESFKNFIKGIKDIMKKKIIEKNDALFDEFLKAFENYESDDIIGNGKSVDLINTTGVEEEKLEIDTDGNSGDVYNLNKEITLSGGGCKFCITLDGWTFWLKEKFYTSYFYQPDLLKKLKEKLAKFLDFLLTTNLLVEEIKEVFVEYKNKFIQWVLSEDCVSITIDTLSFSFVNFVIHLLTNQSITLRQILCNIIFVAIRSSGLGRKYLGPVFVTAQVANFISLVNPANLTAYLIRSLGMQMTSHFLKKKAQYIECLKPVATDIIAKDILGIKWYDKVSYKKLRSVSYVLLAMALFYPRAVIILSLITLIIYENKIYLDSCVIQANVKLAFSSVLSKVNRSNRLQALKQIAAKKFSGSKYFVDNDDKEGCQIAGDVERDNQNDDEPVVEFDYDGSYLEKETPKSKRLIDFIQEGLPEKINWADEAEEAENRENMTGLNFSILEPTINRRFKVSNVDCKLSNVLLTYPHSYNYSPRVTGDMNKDAITEFYYLEGRKLNTEMGKIDNVIGKFECLCGKLKTFKQVVWDLRNYIDDRTLYVSDDGVKWFRLYNSEEPPVTLEGKCKFDEKCVLKNFNTEIDGFQVTSDEFLGLYTKNRCVALEKFCNDLGEFTVIDQERDIKFFNKPPGAGKTTTIVKSILMDVEKRQNPLALTCTSAGKNEIIDKLREKGLRNGANYVKTYDAFMMRMSEVRLDKVYCDEIFMVHAGQWMACLNLMKCDVIRCYGDKNQIPFINRVPNSVCKFSYEPYESYKIFHDNISYRCPVDVCYLLSSLQTPDGKKLYPNGVYPAGKNKNVLRSMQVEPIHSVNDLKPVDGVKTIAFTQFEKDDVSKRLSSKSNESRTCNTVHEVQGGTFPKVDLVRIRQYDNPVYNSINQFIVSVSRHTEKLNYKVLNNKMNDFTGEKISALNTVADYVIKEHHFKQCV
ncbi:polyprotein 1a [Diodia vein chlorosis virus]|nr:polyprotein 1a [Diodia vein chlorosis virus]ADU25041.1 polyprotein 1a [Diodia vein chlorosis virus]